MKLSLILTFSLMFFVNNSPALRSLIRGCDSSGTITVRESMHTFKCSDLVQEKGVMWNLHFINGTVKLLGMCDSQNCINNVPNVKVKWKNNTISELVVLQFDTNWNDSLLVCGETSFGSSCRIIMQSSGNPSPYSSTRIYEKSTSTIFSILVSTYHSTTKLRGTLPTVSSTTANVQETRTAAFLIAGIIGFVMGTAVTVIVIVIVFKLRRQRKRTSEDGANNNGGPYVTSIERTTNALQGDSSSQADVCTANEGAYSSLQMAEVGQRSPYAEFHIYKK